MTTVESALEIIGSHSVDFGVETIPFADSVGRVLAEEIYADRDFPPFDRATMDGIAISHSDWKKGQRTFPIKGEQFAGSPVLSLVPGTCVEIMTGAVATTGADLVIRYEDVEIENGEARVMITEVTNRMNIHGQGTDAKASDTLVKAGKTISYGDIGVLSTVGKVEVLVKKRPAVALISTGDELVEPHETPLPHQIRKSNIHTLCALLKQEGLEFKAFHLNDVWEEILKELQVILSDYDLVLMSGGVSKGKRDFIPEALEELGIKKHFHRVMQRPGKPLWFGTNESTTVFGFPGNPVSTLACYLVYCRHWMHSGYEITATSYAELTTDIRFEKDLTWFVPVSIANQGGVLKASLMPGHGSGDLANLSQADGFIELGRGKDLFQKGEVYTFHPFTK